MTEEWEDNRYDDDDISISLRKAIFDYVGGPDGERLFARALKEVERLQQENATLARVVKDYQDERRKE